MRNYKHFGEKEREIIYLGLQEGLSKQKIAKKVNRHPSSIGREIKRSSSLLNISLNGNKEAKEDKNNYHYLPDRANIKYNKRKKEAGKQRPILKGADFFYVIESIKKGYSPEIICGRMKEMNLILITCKCRKIFKTNKNKKIKSKNSYKYD